MVGSSVAAVRRRDKSVASIYPRRPMSEAVAPTRPSKRILTGDRPTGRLHLGHLVGSLDNRVKLQEEYDTILIVADLHMLTTKPTRDDIEQITENARGLVLDYLAAGINPAKTTIYLQSAIPEIYELNTLFENMVTVNRLARLPDGAHQAVTLRALPNPAQLLVLQPFGGVNVSQKVCPLGIAIQRFGATTPQSGSVFRIVDVTVAGGSAETDTLQEEFAPAQFFTMTDAEKLSRPSFAAYEAGIAIGTDA